MVPQGHRRRSGVPRLVQGFVTNFLQEGVVRRPIVHEGARTLRFCLQGEVTVILF